MSHLGGYKVLLIPAVLVKLGQVAASPGGLSIHRWLPHIRVPDVVSLRRELRVCTSIHVPGDGGTAGLGTTWRITEPLRFQVSGAGRSGEGGEGGQQGGGLTSPGIPAPLPAPALPPSRLFALL